MKEREITSRRSEDGEELYLINAVSRMVNLSQKRIREYEKEGFIKPRREKSTNNRLYSSFDISQIRQINRLIHEHGFTLACLRKMMVLCKCWDIFSCPHKHGCPAFDSPLRPCYEMRNEAGGLNEERCSGCPIHLNKNVSPGKILNQPAFDD
jgi:MerR family transcriptional regulator, repressor of the yfmOP operon